MFFPFNDASDAAAAGTQKLFVVFSFYSYTYIIIVVVVSGALLLCFTFDVYVQRKQFQQNGILIIIFRLKI